MNNKFIRYYSGVSVLTFLYICFISGLYAEYALLEHFVVPADYSVVLETKVRFGISETDLLSDDQVTEILSKKVEKQRNLAVFAILLGMFFSLTAVATIAILLDKLFFMIIVIKDYKTSKKIKNQFYFSAVPSAFFFFYWAVCISAIATSCELLFEVTNTAVPHVAVSDITEYRLRNLQKPVFTDKDVADLVNEVAFVQRWDHQSVQAGQIVLFFFAVTGFAMLVITTISYSQNILR